MGQGEEGRAGLGVWAGRDKDGRVLPRHCRVEHGTVGNQTALLGRRQHPRGKLLNSNVFLHDRSGGAVDDAGGEELGRSEGSHHRLVCSTHRQTTQHRGCVQE